MNKPFVKESDRDGDDDLPEAQALPAGVRNYMTPEGDERLRNELAHLMTVKRPVVVQMVCRGRPLMAIVQKTATICMAKRLREIDRCMRFLTKRLGIAEGVDPAA